MNNTRLNSIKTQQMVTVLSCLQVRHFRFFKIYNIFKDQVVSDSAGKCAAYPKVKITLYFKICFYACTAILSVTEAYFMIQFCLVAFPSFDNSVLYCIYYFITIIVFHFCLKHKKTATKKGIYLFQCILFQTYAIFQYICLQDNRI